jgi:tetratricopeptide (TPR) repeat protein
MGNTVCIDSDPADGCREGAPVAPTSDVVDPPASSSPRPEILSALPGESSSDDDADDLRILIGALRQHDRLRRGSQSVPRPDEQFEAKVRAVCLVLVESPAELGVEGAKVGCSQETQRILSDTASLDLPEAAVCRAWLAAHSEQANAPIADTLATLDPASLWFPVRALAFRLLAHLGRRKCLVDLLARSGSVTVVEADAWLEGASHDGVACDALGRLVPLEAGVLPQQLVAAWQALLMAELALADIGPVAEQDAAFVRVMALADAPLPAGYVGGEQRRLAARAAAARARSALARGQEVRGVLGSPAGLGLPAWERDYLGALGLLLRGQRAQAETLLEAALAKNPSQDSVRTALAFSWAERRPQAALEVLEHAEAAWALLVSRALIQARLGRFDDALASLACADSPECTGRAVRRLSWVRGRRQLWRRQAALRVALAELKGDWQSAEKAAEVVWGGGQRKTLLESRRLYSAHRQAQSLGSSEAWRRVRLEQRLERGRHELGSVPLVGDALFFRAQVACGHDPARAVKDLQTLMRQRAWVDAQRRVGGARIVAAGDLLLRLGETKAAVDAYEVADRIGVESVSDRLTIAAMLSGGLAGTLQPPSTTDATTGASPWPPLVAAAQCLCNGHVDLARTALAQAVRRGAPEGLCQAVRTLLGCAAGETTFSANELAGVGLPRDAMSALRLHFGPGSEADRIKAFVSEHGGEWLDKLPGHPESAARRVLSSLCNDGAWTEALRSIDALEHAPQPWARELWALVKIRHALELAVSGKLAEGERELRSLEVAGQ